MKKILFATALVALMCGACNEMNETPAVGGAGKKYTASFEESKPEGRVYLGEDNYYRWNAGDEVSVFAGDYSHRKYKATTGDAVTTDLEYVSVVSESTTALPTYNYAIFPFAASNSLEGGVLYSNIASEQAYNTNNLNHAIMVSRVASSSSEFVFKNSCALVKVNVKIAEDFAHLHKVKSISLTSKSKKLSGPATINVAAGDYTAVVDETAETAKSSVTLTDCEAAGTLEADTYKTYYLAIPAGEYAAGDLIISVITSSSSTSFNVKATLAKNHTVGRSQYIELSTTVAKDYTWFEQENENEVVIKENVTLTNKAIMADTENLLTQGFEGAETVETVFDVPGGDFTITGAELVNAGVAADGPNGPVITFETTDEHYYIINTLTTSTSGLKATATANVNTVTMSNLTITGELRTTCMGIYVDPRNWKPANTYDQSKFHTVWNKVNVTDCKVIPFNSDDKKIGAAVCVFGIAELNDCKLTGTTESDFVKEAFPGVEFNGYYDMACTNASHTYINGGEVGSIFGWEQAKFTFSNGAKIGKLYTIGISTGSLGPVVVNDATVDQLIMDPSGNYQPMLTLNNGAVVNTLEFIGVTDWSKVTINEGATVGKVIVDGVEMTLEAFKADILKK